MRVLGHPLKGDEEVISGESGAVTMGALYEMLTNKDYYSITDKLDINSDSSILLFSTEGDTDPDMYREIVCNSDT
jgi:diaminopropionate ammonia-lyase